MYCLLSVRENAMAFVMAKERGAGALIPLRRKGMMLLRKTAEVRDRQARRWSVAAEAGSD
jgi:hypothetical protein